jgi:hypothetical protein
MLLCVRFGCCRKRESGSCGRVCDGFLCVKGQLDADCGCEAGCNV